MKKNHHLLVLFFSILVLGLGYPHQLFAADFCVDDMSDGAASGGDCDADCTDMTSNCSLRDAITASEGTAGPNRIIFDIGAGGLQTITLDNAQGPLPTITVPLEIDGTTQGNFAGTPLIEIDGTNLTNGDEIGLHITAGNSTIRSLAVINFPDDGIRLETNGNNSIYGCYIGLEADGDTAAGNDDGVDIRDSSDNVIGGAGANEGNVLSGNGDYGVRIDQGSPDNNVIQGNLIGTDATGTLDRGNGGVDAGILVSDGNNNQIGGDQPGEGNVISGQGRGITASSNQTEIIQGNFIGTDITGTVAIPNTFSGILLSNSDAIIGGTTPGAGNLISGNNADAIIFSNVVNGFTIQGNLIGTDINGTSALPNDGTGIRAQNIRNSLIGGTDPGATNVISGNTENGILVTGSNAGEDVLIQNNLIGTDINGDMPIPNGENGIEFSNSNFDDLINNLVGGQEANAGNVIAFNTLAGVKLSNPFSSDIREIGILSNSIFSNGDLGISIDAGLNNGVTPPTLTSVFNFGTLSEVRGQLNGQPNSDYLIQIFGNTALDPSGFGEGEFFLGQQNVTTDGSGMAEIILTFEADPQNGLLVLQGGEFSGKQAALPGDFVTTTATDPMGSTSEFSNGLAVMEGSVAQFTMADYSVDEDGGTATITIMRAGNLDEAVSVDFTTSDGTAVAGTNYESVQVTLNFAAGETSQEVTIPIINQNSTQNFTVFLTLSNTTAGILLGDPSEAILTILGSNNGSITPGVGNKGGGCSLGSRPDSGWILPWVIALMLGFGIFLRRRIDHPVSKQ